MLEDYGGNARIITPEGTYSGKSEIRQFFRRFLAGTPGLGDSFRVTRLEVQEDIGYLAWEAPGVAFGNSTFIVRNGDITLQTFSPYRQQ